MPNEPKVTGFQVGNTIIPYVKSDFSQEDDTAPDYIKNKPEIASTEDTMEYLGSHSYNLTVATPAEGKVFHLVVGGGVDDGVEG